MNAVDGLEGIFTKKAMVGGKKSVLVPQDDEENLIHSLLCPVPPAELLKALKRF